MHPIQQGFSRFLSKPYIKAVTHSEEVELCRTLMADCVTDFRCVSISRPDFSVTKLVIQSHVASRQTGNSQNHSKTLPDQPIFYITHMGWSSVKQINLYMLAGWPNAGLGQSNFRTDIKDRNYLMVKQKKRRDFFFSFQFCRWSSLAQINLYVLMGWSNAGSRW